MHYIFILYSLLISIGINLIFFLIAFYLKKDTFTDITYAATFAITGAIVWAINQQVSVVQILIYIAIFLWAIRLGGYLFIRILKIKVDHRFDSMRDKFWLFGRFWIIQAITCWAVGLPTYFALSVPSTLLNNTNDEWFMVAFFIVAILFLTWETIADQQKNHFYNNRKKPDFMHEGLFKICRHPNYFGEIGFWFSITIGFIGTIMLNNLSANNNYYWQLLWLLCPIFIMLLINFLSGVNLLERNTYKKYHSLAHYQNYIDKTPIIIPIIGKRGHCNFTKRYMNKNNKVDAKTNINKLN